MSTMRQSRFLDLRALASLENMRFTTTQRVEGPYSGRHPSRRQGGAGEFVDFREYSGAEDLRRIDWKVLARTGKAFVRLHQEETNLRSLLAIDASGSMGFGGLDPSRSKGKGPANKLEYAQYLATALSHVIHQGRDQVGLATLDEELREYIAPSGAPTHLIHVQQLIEEVTVRPARRMAEGLQLLFKRVKGRGVLILMSDFLCEDVDKLFAAVRLFRHRSWEVIILHIVHPEEEQLPEGAAWRFEGMEGEGSLACSPTEIRTAYKRRFEAHCAMIRRQALAGGCDYRYTSTGIDYMKTLGGFLVARSG